MPEQTPEPKAARQTVTGILPKPEQSARKATPDYLGDLVKNALWNVISQYTGATVRDMVIPELNRLNKTIIEYINEKLGEGKAYTDAELKTRTEEITGNITNYVENLQAEDRDLRSLIEQAKGESQVLVSNAEKGLRKLLDAALKKVGETVKSLRDKDSDLEGKVSGLAAASKEHGETLERYKTDIEEAKKSATDQVSGARKALELQISGVKTALENKMDTDGKKKDSETVAVRRDLISYEGRLGRSEATLRILEESGASKEEVGGLKTALETLRTDYDSFKRTVEARIEKINQESIARVEEVIKAVKEQAPGAVERGAQIPVEIMAEIKLTLAELIEEEIKRQVARSISLPEAPLSAPKPTVHKDSSSTVAYKVPPVRQSKDAKSDDKGKKGGGTGSTLGDLLTRG